jgi:inner membrane protein
MGMVESIIYERAHMYRQATDDITASWGGEQLITGPVLSLPYLVTQTEAGNLAYENRYKHVRPSNLSMNVTIETQVRYRGIYKVPVYTVVARVQGEFDLSNITFETYNTTEFAIDEAFVQLPLGEPRSLRGPVDFLWDNEGVSLVPEWHGMHNENVSMFAGLPVEMTGRDTPHRFEMVIRLTGSNELAFASVSPDTAITMEANWGSPGFFGIYLPASHEIHDDGFTAAWDINNLLPGPGHELSRWAEQDWFGSQARFGVRLVQPVDTYQLVTRAAKYAVLFISLTFLVYFFTEVMTRTTLHPVQYLLVGGATCLFYLLLLSLAEHIPFALAYGLSAFASILLITLYSVSILKSRSRAFIMFLMLSALYVYLFVTLRSEAYALLTGSTGLFVVLTLVMYLSRNIDWHKRPTSNGSVSP